MLSRSGHPGPGSWGNPAVASVPGDALRIRGCRQGEANWDNCSCVLAGGAGVSIPEPKEMAPQLEPSSPQKRLAVHFSAATPWLSPSLLLPTSP